MRNGFKSLQEVLHKQNLRCPLFFVQNNGTLIDLLTALEFPLTTISAGPTNSFIGGAKLANLEHAIIVDIGGISTDVGVVHNNFPRRSINSSSAGIPLNFSMPDVFSIGLGGGSHVTLDDAITIGPESCGRKIMHEACLFGGTQLTLTDVALKNNFIAIPGADSTDVIINENQIAQMLSLVKEKIMALTDRMAGAARYPIIFVGGGAQLFPAEFFGDKVIVPQYGHVANAYGAALAEISATIDTVVSLNERDSVLEEIKTRAITETVSRGAEKSTVRIIDQHIMPYNYMPNNQARVIITAAGKQDL